jgi:hypothetical protein
MISRSENEWKLRDYWLLKMSCYAVELAPIDKVPHFIRGVGLIRGSSKEEAQ